MKSFWDDQEGNEGRSLAVFGLVALFICGMAFGLWLAPFVEPCPVYASPEIEASEATSAFFQTTVEQVPITFIQLSGSTEQSGLMSVQISGFVTSQRSF